MENIINSFQSYTIFKKSPLKMLTFSPMINHDPKYAYHTILNFSPEIFRV